jgi:hypothetical protein
MLYLLDDREEEIDLLFKKTTSSTFPIFKVPASRFVIKNNS